MMFWVVIGVSFGMSVFFVLCSLWVVMGLLGEVDDFDFVVDDFDFGYWGFVVVFGRREGEGCCDDCDDSDCE